MTDLFNKCIDVILRNEGGYVNDPDDSGGETNYGISKRAFPDSDIKNLTQDEAKQIYYDNYWLPLYLEALNDINAALQIFDMAVNAGVTRAVKIAQKVTNVLVDGKMGVITLGAINTCECFTVKYKNARIDYYYNIAVGKNTKYLFGWIKRVNNTIL
jgi:lysozyme family protein